MNAASEVPFCGTVRLKSQIGYFLPHEVERMGCFMTHYAADGLLRVGGAAVAQRTISKQRQKAKIVFIAIIVFDRRAGEAPLAARLPFVWRTAP